MAEIHQLTCKRCEYKWYPESPTLPKTCAKCKNPNWNKEKQHEN